MAWRHAAKSSHFELEEMLTFLGQTLIKELIISQKLLWIRRGEYCMHIIYAKMFHICKDFLVLMWNSQVTAFYKRFDSNVGTIPLIQNDCFLKITESDLLFVMTYLISNSRIASWHHHLWSIFRKISMMKLSFSM